MSDEFILKDHIKIYMGDLPTATGGWPIVLDNFNVVSIDIDRNVQSTGGFSFVNQPGTARIVLRSNIVGGDPVDTPFDNFGSGGHAVKVVATIYPDTNPTDVVIFWGYTESVVSSYNVRDRQNTTNRDYTVTMNCVDMLGYVNTLPMINITPDVNSQPAGYPEDRFLFAMTRALYPVAHHVEYSGVTFFPAETQPGYSLSCGELLQEIQTSDLAFVACDYANERINFYGRYFLPDLLTEIDNKEASAAWVGFSDTHLDTTDHYCCYDLNLSWNSRDVYNYAYLTKKTDSAITWQAYSGSTGISQEGWRQTINCSTVGELQDIASTVLLGGDSYHLDNVSASVIRPKDQKLTVGLVTMQPVLDFARVRVHRDGSIINKAFMVTGIHHRIDPDQWVVDVAGVRLNIDSLPITGGE